MDDLKRLEERALAIIAEETGVEDLRISGVQRLAETPVGYTVYVFSAAPASAMNRSVGAAALTERGERVDLDRILGADLEPVFPGGTVLEPVPADHDIPPVRIDPGTIDLHLGSCEEFTERIRVLIPASSAVPQAWRRRAPVRRRH